jgi:putative SOS response-associated peptidase YedK
MCGRYVSPDEAALEREYRIDRRNSHLQLSDTLERAYEASYNVAPTDRVPVVRVIRDTDGEREAVLMPILQDEDVETWLRGTLAQARAALKEYPSDLMLAWPVSSHVSSPKNDDADLIRPEAEPLTLFQRGGASSARRDISSSLPESAAEHIALEVAPFRFASA